ncbi:MAG: alpha/beta hydrolase family protein [Thermoguttaceae bacterium]|jgi:dienelactone hydrolase
MKRCPVIVAFACVLCAGAVAAAEPGLDVPAASIPGDKSGTMMHGYWLRQAEQAAKHWQEEYEARKTPAQIASYQARLREKFLEAIGGLPERTPLNAKVTGTIQRDGYRVEKVIFESQAKHFVTALLFLPGSAGKTPRGPGVLVPCGHSKDGKGSEAYQTMGALLALNGMTALVVDPIDQGERGQYLGPGGWPDFWGTDAHSLLGIGSTLLGRNTARFEIWDDMRAIDYLQSRPEVDRERIGCTGNSGGGTQTSYMMALDERIRAAAPSCYLCGFPALLSTIGPQDAEQNIFGQLAFGMDHADYITMRAPRPVLMCTATKDFFDIHGAWDTFRCAKRLYTRMGLPERVDILENDAGHNYGKVQREGVVRWMARWLLGKDQPITEPAVKLLVGNELQCTPQGQVMLLAGARSTYDLNEDYEKQLAPRRAELWKTGERTQLLGKVRQLAGIRRLAELPKPHDEEFGSIQRTGYRIEKLLLKPEEEIVLPALEFIPEKPKAGQAALYLHEEGKAADAAPGGAIERLVREGTTVLAVDLPGTGQTKAASETGDGYTAYLLGRSCVGRRAENVLIAARWLKEQTPGQPAAVGLVAVGLAGIPALHAAALESDLFQSVELSRAPHSWSAVVHARLAKLPISQVVQGALLTYDLPDLAATLGAKLTQE